MLPAQEDPHLVFPNVLCLWSDVEFAINLKIITTTGKLSELAGEGLAHRSGCRTQEPRGLGLRFHPGFANPLPKVDGDCLEYKFKPLHSSFKLPGKACRQICLKGFHLMRVISWLEEPFLSCYVKSLCTTFLQKASFPFTSREQAHGTFRSPKQSYISVFQSLSLRKACSVPTTRPELYLPCSA